MSKMLVVIVATLLAFSAVVEPSSAEATTIGLWKLSPKNPPLPVSGNPYRRGCSTTTRCRGGTPSARKLLTILKNATN
ncbi:hypothetical protein AAHA92_04942 [Salvia divinorum]|uniref:Uncharacterized protein n=1 Tax=Salvia divinorum TaxID=28513 RepID=A0ABD1I3I1_SALDI